MKGKKEKRSFEKKKKKLHEARREGGEARHTRKVKLINKKKERIGKMQFSGTRSPVHQLPNY